MAGNTTDIQVLNELKEAAASVLNDATHALGVGSLRHITRSHFNKLKKDEVSDILHQALLVLEDFSIVLATDFEIAPNCVKNQMFESNRQLLNCNPT